MAKKVVDPDTVQVGIADFQRTRDSVCPAFTLPSLLPAFLPVWSYSVSTGNG